MAKAIMIQGTMSNVGKSYVAAALCRIFKQDGYRVAPFKSQNMALNSYITEDGFEMGRAQAMQAEAAGVAPEVSMNPILLKPTTDIGSQVIVNGISRGNMHAAAYFRYKAKLIPEIMDAYQRLDNAYDIIVIEGAGSPVELNLKQDDIVNMGMAKLANAPVLLVGDIDRGGVFAQLLGTCNLLETDERALVKGLLVNKFRGDGTLFTDGKRILEEMSGLPVVGVIPHTHVEIDDEDSLSDKLNNKESGVIDIAVIRLKRISNFTDFDVFCQYEGTHVRYVSKPEEFKTPDLVILPGTKSTISDLLWLRESGLEKCIIDCVSQGTPLFGICGGYQMLGKSISDPEYAEGGGVVCGMGLLPVHTVFQREKCQRKVTGTIGNLSGDFINLSGAAFEGYEIHMGQTTCESHTPFSTLSSGETDGANVKNVYGSYVHGIFDSRQVSGEIIKTLYKKKKIPFCQETLDRATYKQTQYDLLARQVRQSVDMDRIYDILMRGV